MLKGKEKCDSREPDCNRYVGVLHKVNATFGNYIIMIWFIAGVKDFLYFVVVLLTFNGS